jgi:hypothetical protein
MSGHRQSSSVLIDHLHQAIIFFIETVDDVGGEFGITKRLANGGQRVREFPNLVVVVRDAQVQLLALAKLTTESIGTRLRLSREGLLEDAPCLVRGLGEDDETSNPPM